MVPLRGLIQIVFTAIFQSEFWKNTLATHSMIFARKNKGTGF
jgi:hypothetical protein